MIKILITGGTLDKIHDPISESLIFSETHLPEILRVTRSRLEISTEQLMLIDSLKMTDEDRQKILATCQAAEEDKIVITHGTSNMEVTAQVLGEAGLAKTIVLTGAMVPYSLRNSDALFNVGTALAFVQTLPQGVYVAMNGKYYAWDNVTKNVEVGLFEEKE